MQAIPTLLIVITFTFILTRMIPGNPALTMLGPQAPKESVEKLEEELGLNKSKGEQYVIYLNQILHGDFGKSYAYNQSVVELIDPIDVLRKVGGFDIAALAGLCLGGALNRIPVLMDGFISGVAALIAVRLCPAVSGYLLASHVSKEPAAVQVLEAMGKEAMIHGKMCMGEGTGAAALFPLLDMAATIYNTMSTFEDIHMDQYEHLE